MQIICFYFSLAFVMVILSSASSLNASRILVANLSDRVVMNCNVGLNGSAGAEWEFTEFNSSKASTINYGGADVIIPKRSRYKIDKNVSGQHDLIIESVGLDYAGRYKCTTDAQRTLWSDIQLTILGSDPVCAVITTNATVDGNQQTIWCSISYTGYTTPVFAWIQINKGQNIAANETTSGLNVIPMTSTSSIMVQLHANDSGVTFQCQITFQIPNNSETVYTNYTYTWNYTLLDPNNSDVTQFRVNTDSTKNSNDPNFPITVLAIGGSLLFLLIIAIVVSCHVHRRKRKDDTNDRPDVALHTDVTTDESDVRTIDDNAVYAEVCKPKGPSKGGKGGNIGDKPRPPQAKKQETTDFTGADGTVYAELSGMKPPPVSKGSVPKAPTYNAVEIYASIDHNERAPQISSKK